MKQTFENYLGDIHCREHPEILDDQLPDHFNDWLTELDVDDLIKWANEFAAQAHHEGYKKAMDYTTKSLKKELN